MSTKEFSSLNCSNMKKSIQLLSLIFVGVSQVAFSQIKDEKLILDRKREPEIRKIEKKKTSIAQEKDYPPQQKRLEDSLSLRYNITNVPPVSDFRTSSIQGEDISPEFDASYHENYFRLGMGNYGKILADGTIATTLENKMEVGADVHFLSTTGLKKEYPWKSDQSSANVGAFLNSYGEKGKLGINADYGLNDYNYYGIYAVQPDADVDLQQKTNRFQVNGFYDHYSNEILNDVRVKSSFISDHFDATESNAGVFLNLSKHGVDIPRFDEVSFNADLGLGLETVKSNFEIVDKNSSSYLKGAVVPEIKFQKGDSYIRLGSDFSFLNGTYQDRYLDEKLKNNKTYWFPKAELQFAAMDQFKFYGGVDGGLQLNTYANLLEENPYLVSDLQLRPTETKYKVYFGLRGDVDETFKYDVSAGFGEMKNILFFEANNLFDNLSSLNRSAYNFANTFSAAYDNGSVSEVKGSVQYFPLQNLVLDGELHFAKYKLENYRNIYNRPLVTASLGGKYTMLDKKLHLGAQAIFSSDKTTNSFTVEPHPNDPGLVVTTEDTNDKVGGFADLNLSAEYKVHKNFSIFALGNNLLNTKYQTFKGYKVLGAQILGGVKISF